MAEVTEGSNDALVYHPSDEISKNALIPSMDVYQKMYNSSVDDPTAFWKEVSDSFYWKVPPREENFLSYNFDVSKGSISIKWMQGAVTNICYNVLDRHVVDKGHGDKIAFYWEGNDPDDCSKITYKELLEQVCKFANVLKMKGVKKGDRVAIYLPMIVEAVVAMLACARIGAIHSVVFAGFSADSLAERILDSKCCIVVTVDGVWRGSKLLNLKNIVDDAVQKCRSDNHELIGSIVVQHLTLKNKETNGITDEHLTTIPGKRPHYDLQIKFVAPFDSWWHEDMMKADANCEPEWMDAEDPLFMLYTSGSTGKPKGVLHTVAGYMLYSATTFKYDFDHHPETDIYWCTADVGWITGHSYIVYGPMADCATGVLFEGVPFFPDAGRFWAIIEKYKVSKFYTAPTAIRALMKSGDDIVKKYDRSSLIVLGTVGEPINPEAWLWYYNVVGDSQCSIVDTFWQTETGGHALTSLPGATPMKPGSATFPFFGIIPTIMNDSGEEISGEGSGYLCFKQPWPGIMRTIYGNHQRYEDTYFKKFPGYYFTGDGARRDKDGYLWVTGRVDDTINTSGHLISTAEVESALIEHKSVAETAVVGHPHAVKGQSLYCFIILKNGFEFTDQLKIELKQLVRTKIGAFATPDYLQHVEGLPKTRSGKIMRRILRKITVNDRDLGDISTMADSSILDKLFSTRVA